MNERTARLLFTIATIVVWITAVTNYLCIGILRDQITVLEEIQNEHLEAHFGSE